MKINDIIVVFSENKSDEYYVELSAKEILLVPVLIQFLTDGNFYERIKASEILDKISAKYPLQIQPFVSYILIALDKNNDLASWGIWKILSRLKEEIIKNDEICDRFIAALYSEKIAEFSILCDCAERFVQAKPELDEKIKFVFSKIDEREFSPDNAYADASMKIAKEKVDIYLRNN